VFVTNYTCDGDPKVIREARKSFVSGHTSFSFYCATFLTVYLQTRLNPHPRSVRK
jgi:phosphatidate phosphatase